jgi:Family of unknown function (DUF6152)
MTARALPILCLMMLATMAVSVSAHHSTVAYAEQSIVLKNATITKVLWDNPHIILTFTVKETSGVVTWSTESGSPGSVARLGWNRNSVKPGDKVTIQLFPSKNGAHVGRLNKVIFPDGHELLDTQTNPDSIKHP